MTWAANNPANNPANRATTPYGPDDTVARLPRRQLSLDWIDDVEPVEGVGPIPTPLAPDGQPPRGVQRARPPAPRAETRRRRRRGSAARRLAVRLTDRDGAILTDLVRFGALGAEQVGRRHFASVRTAYGRLKALARAGYLELVRVWHGRPGAYVATAEGARVAGVALPPAKITAATLAHHLAVADLADRLLAEHPGARWLTERELRRDAMAAARERGTGRLFDGVPHVPDGVLVLPGGRRIAVELDSSAKGSARYRTILRWYAARMAYGAVRWFVTEAPLCARLAALIQAERLDELVSVDRIGGPIASNRRPAEAGRRQCRAWAAVR